MGGVTTRSELAYDRSVPEPLLTALAPDGPFHDLVAAVEKFPADPLDIHLRALGKDRGHATLYLGLTRILDLRYQEGKGFWITAQDGKSFGGAPDRFLADIQRWKVPQPTAKDLDREALSRRSFCEAMVAATRDPKSKAHRYVSKEGQLQAALQRQAGLTLIDREVVVSMAGLKDLAMKDARAPLRDALESLMNRPDCRRWAHTRHAGPGKAPEGVSGFGQELDALAIDESGRMLAIEVKHAYDTNGVGWTPAQVAVYLRLLRAWAEPDSEKARKTLDGMLFQRRQVLGAGGTDVAARPLELVPAIVIGQKLGRSAPEAARRMSAVRDALADAGEPLHGLRVWQLLDDDLHERAICELE